MLLRARIRLIAQCPSTSYLPPNTSKNKLYSFVPAEVLFCCFITK